MSYFFKTAKIGLIRTALTRSFKRSVNKGSIGVNPTPPKKGGAQREAITPMRAWKHRVNNEDRLIHDLANEGESACVDTTIGMKPPLG